LVFLVVLGVPVPWEFSLLRIFEFLRKDLKHGFPNELVDSLLDVIVKRRVSVVRSIFEAVSSVDKSFLVGG
jgi:hypothetical protein